MFPSKSLKSTSFSCVHQVYAIVAVLTVAVLSAQPVQGAEIGWRRDLQVAYREAASLNKPILVVVGARWCGYCRQLHQQTLHNAGLVSRINDQFVPLLIDVDEQPEVTQQLQVEMLPTILVISPQRRILDRSTGFQTVAQLDSRLAAFKPVATKASTELKASLTLPSGRAL